MKSTLVCIVLCAFSLFFVCQTIQHNYPACIPDAEQRARAKSAIYSHLNFFQSGSFVTHQSSKYTSKYIYSSQSSNALTFQYLFLRQTYYTYEVIIICLILLLILAIKALIVYFKKMRGIFDQQVIGFIIPCLLMICILFLFISMAMNVVIAQIPQNVNTARCIRRNTKQVILYGDNNSNWAGLLGHKNLLQLQAKYLQIVQIMSPSFNSHILTIKYQRNAIAQFPIEFTNRFFSAFIINPYNNQKVMIKNLIPSLFTNIHNKSLFSKIYSQHMKMAKISKLALKIQDIVENIKQRQDNSSTALRKKMMQFVMMAKAIQRTHLFNQEGQGQFDRHYQHFLLLGKIYLGFGYTTIFFYFLFIISISTTNKCLKITTNFLWLMIMIQFLLGIIFLYWILPISDSLSIECPYFYKLLINQTYYDSMFSKSTSGLNQYTTFFFTSNLYQLMQPCIFSKGSNTNFTSYTGYEYDSMGLVALMANLQLYMNITNPVNTHFIDLHAYSKVYSQAIQYVKDQMKGKTQNWIWLQGLLQKINNYTLNNINHDSCYRHRWVFHSSGCGAGQDIYKWPKISLLVPQGSYKNAKIVCFPLIIEKKGKINVITYKQFIKSYMLNINETRCQASIKTILNLSLILTDTLMLKKQSLQKILVTLQQQQISLAEYFRAIRYDHVIKWNQYQYLLSEGFSDNITAQSYLNYTYSLKQQNNCTIIRYWMNYLFEETCIAFRANVLRVLVALKAQIICLGFIICCGCCHEIKQQSYLQFTPIQDTHQDVGRRKNIKKSKASSNTIQLQRGKEYKKQRDD